MRGKQKFSGLKKSGRVEVLLTDYGSSADKQWAKSELLKLGFVQSTPAAWVNRHEEGGVFLVRECSRKTPLDREALGHALNIEYDQFVTREFSWWQCL